MDGWTDVHDIIVIKPNFLSSMGYRIFLLSYKLIEAGRTEDIFQVQGLSIDGLNNNEDITIQ